jgi:hypothetical protein
MNQNPKRPFPARALCLAALGLIPLCAAAQTPGPALLSLRAMAPDASVAGAAFTGERPLPAAAAEDPARTQRVAMLVESADSDAALTPDEKRRKELYGSHSDGSTSAETVEFYGGLSLMALGGALLISNPTGMAVVGVGLFVLGVLGITLGGHDATSSESAG